MDDDSKIDLHAGANYALKTHTILGCAFDVLNEHGHGLNEKCYENSLVVESSCEVFRLTSNADTKSNTKDTSSGNSRRT